MDRQVFISYAAGDPDWTAERVEAFANVLDTLGVSVHLDVRYQESLGQNIAPAVWREWMDGCLRAATNVVCLCSERYAQAWQRKESLSGGCGVAFESARIERHLYDSKQNNHGRVIVVVSGAAGSDVVPGALKDACPKYEWGNSKDDRYLRSHLSGQGFQNIPLEPPIEDKDDPVQLSSETVDSMLRHQADHAADSLEKCPELWRALQRSKDLKDCLGGIVHDSPVEMICSLSTLSAVALQDVMLEVREVFKDVRDELSESQKRVRAAEAAVAIYLVCASLLIKVQSPSRLSGLPKLDSDTAANLFACLIGMAMAGGKLVLVQGNNSGLPMAEGALAVQLVGGVPGCEAKDEFERNLHALVVLGPGATESGLKVGKLDDQERANLIERLRARRKTRSRTVAMSVVLFAKDPPADGDTALVTDLGIPVFSMHHQIAYELLGGITAERLLAMLRELWLVVVDDMRGDRTSAEPPSRSETELSELVHALHALAESLGQHAASKEIQANAEALQRAVDADSPPQRDVLARTRETLDGLNQVGESAEKLIPRLLQLLNYFF